MRKILLCCALAALCFLCANAQEKDTTKCCNQYISLQANQLLKQLINLNNSSSVISNPYLLTYGIFSAKSGWGFQAGLGYNYQKITDKLSTTGQESKINDLFYRLGFAKKSNIGKRWEGSWGFDFAGSHQGDKTFASTVTDFGAQKDSTATTSDTKINSYGAGPQLGLSFLITPHILLGTEATLYYSVATNKSNVTVVEYFINSFDPDQNETVYSTSNTETKESDFKITVPVAIFLTIKF